MERTWLPLAAALAYAMVLFVVAWRTNHAQPRREGRLPTFVLSLAVYATSWTFFGAVGTAATSGWNYLPIYLGPALVFLLAPAFLTRLVQAAKAEGATSIADFISARYGKSRSLAALVTALALFAALPYIALQLKSVAMSYGELVAGAPGGRETPAATAVIAALLALFAITFGTRSYQVTGRNQGLIRAVAVESLVKLLALCAVAAFAVAALLSAPPELQAQGVARFTERFALDGLSADFVTITLLSAAAIVCLPRQFYVGVVECDDPALIRRARWPFVFYLALTSAVALPITLAGLTLLPASAAPDLFVLDLPLARGAPTLALVAFLGGFSAATAMVVVESLALSTMVANDLIAPLLLRLPGLAREAAVGRLLLWARRLTIVAIIGAAYLYHRLTGATGTLASIGLIAFAAVAQFAPALLGAVLWDRHDPRAARAGLLAGMLLWFYTLFLPSALPRETYGWGLFDPQALFGLSGLSPLSHGVLWSLGANLLLFLALSRRTRAARSLTDADPELFGKVTTIGGLQALTARFAGQARTAEVLARYRPDEPVAPEAARRAERLIASVAGAPSARLIVASALSGSSLAVADVVQLLDDTSDSVHFSQGLLAATLEGMDSGVSVVDRDLRLVAWNRRYLELFGFPPGMVRVGRPVAELIRFNMARGLEPGHDADEQIARRLDYMRQGAPYVSERRRPDGTTLRLVGGPIPGGGYVMSFTDVTAERAAQDALAAANERLEARVAERTAELERAARELERARQAAEDATRDKTRFLAAASHDLLQPLHAARLFCAALGDDVPPEAKSLVRNIDRSIGGADQLLRRLLDISKLDAGGIQPQPSRFSLGELVEEVATEFAPLAAEKGLRLRAVPGHAHVETDRALLRSILGNFLSNAVRYTRGGGVLIATRRRGGRVRVEVWDSGPGIPENKHQLIFQEFQRLERPGSSEAGVGLGLAIVRRGARLIGAELSLRSILNKGSVFGVELPSAEPPVVPASRPEPCTAPRGARVLCVDNEDAILQALGATLRGWGCKPRLVSGHAAATAILAAERIDAALVDYHLDGRHTGLDVLAAVRRYAGAIPAALVTADGTPEVSAAAAALGAALLRKPVDPAELRAVLARAEPQTAAA